MAMGAPREYNARSLSGTVWSAETNGVKLGRRGVRGVNNVFLGGGGEWGKPCAKKGIVMVLDLGREGWETTFLS